MRPADSWRIMSCWTLPPQPVGALGPDPADPSRPAGHLEKRRDQPAVGQGRRCLLPLCQGRRAVELPQKAAAEMARSTGTI